MQLNFEILIKMDRIGRRRSRLYCSTPTMQPCSPCIFIPYLATSDPSSSSCLLTLLFQPNFIVQNPLICCFQVKVHYHFIYMSKEKTSNENISFQIQGIIQW